MKNDNIINIGVSIIICCYNSKLKLSQTLAHIVKQKVDKRLEFEVILVDNNSNDETGDYAKETWSCYKTSVKLHIVNEVRPGLSYAREAGVKSANFEIIIFCDDDNWLDESYVQNAYRIMKANSKIGALGGWSEATLPITKLPLWFRNYQVGYAVGKQATQTGDATSRGWLWGAGLVVRKDVYLKAFSRFGSLLIGRNGDQLTSHEDVEICKRIILLGYKLYYSEELFLKHDISENRLTEDYRDRLQKGFETGKEIIYLYDKQIKINNLKPLKKLIIILGIIMRLLKKVLIELNFKDLKWEIETIFVHTGIKLGKIGQTVFVIKKI